jgi:hypothetical protein
MSETNRVQRWREGKRQQGLKAVTIWLTPEEELRLKDLALQGHCSPSAMVGFQEQRADNGTCCIIRLIAHPGLCNAARDWSP